MCSGVVECGGLAHAGRESAYMSAPSRSTLVERPSVGGVRLSALACASVTIRRAALRLAHVHVLTGCSRGARSVRSIGCFLCASGVYARLVGRWSSFLVVLNDQRPTVFLSRLIGDGCFYILMLLRRSCSTRVRAAWARVRACACARMHAKVVASPVSCQVRGYSTSLGRLLLVGCFLGAVPYDVQARARSQELALHARVCNPDALMAPSL